MIIHMQNATVELANGNVTIGDRLIGTVAYDYGFARYGAATMGGQHRKFNQADNETGLATQRRAARWVARQWGCK